MTPAGRFEPLYTPEPMSGCWLWLGAANERDYGLFWLDGKSVRAHRASWKIHKGEPGSLHVLHRCDNTFCVNPEHLFLGTHQNNMDDMKSKGRLVNPRGPQNGNTKLTAEIVATIKSSDDSNINLGRKYGVSAAAIYLVRKGENWSHVAGTPPKIA